MTLSHSPCLFTWYHLKLGLHCLQVYATLRKEAAVSHGMPVAVRHLESMIRMSEASAMMHLREYVNEQDVDSAIR